jgi:hypothetical protein
MSRSGDEPAPDRSDRARPAKPAVPVGGGVPIDPETGERFGYLPRKAAQRKIIVRRALGLPWIVGALGAAALIAVAGAAFFAARPDRPGRPFVDVGPLSAYPSGQVSALPDGTGWVDRRSGLAVWLTTADFCPADGGWQAGGERWDAAGRPAGTPSRGLSQALVRAANGRLYVDPRPRPAATPFTTPGQPLGRCPAPRPVTHRNP